MSVRTRTPAATRLTGVRRGRAAVTVLSALSLTLASCGIGGSSANGEAHSGQQATLTVFAAASLTDTFEQLAEQFESDHPNTQVRVSFAGSSDLVAQIREGAPADVVATADQTTMQRLVDADDVAEEPRIFAANTLTIAVPTGNPQDVAGLQDLAGNSTDVVVCAPQVPCGAATQKVADAAGMTISAVSEEPAVTDVLGKVANGQADAGLVYRTDAAASSAVDSIDFPEADRAVNLYPIAPVASTTQHNELSRQFIDYVLSRDARAVFRAAGFAAPPADDSGTP